MNPPNARETIMLKRSMFGSGALSLESNEDIENALSLEDKTEELEYAIYGKLENLDVLRDATETILQEQWEYRTHGKDGKPSGTLRSRMINEGDAYELTVKAYKSGDVGTIETNLPSDKDMHEAISNLADRCIRKIRYVFPCEVDYNGEKHMLKWEVDQFILPNGDVEDIVKVDFEVPFKEMGLPAIPFDITDPIITGVGKRPTDEEYKVIDGMFKRVTTDGQIEGERPGFLQAVWGQLDNDMSGVLDGAKKKNNNKGE